MPSSTSVCGSSQSSVISPVEIPADVTDAANSNGDKPYALRLKFRKAPECVKLKATCHPRLLPGSTFMNNLPEVLDVNTITRTQLFHIESDDLTFGCRQYA